MKLLFCPACNDIKKLQTRTDRLRVTFCDCELSYGYYEKDNLNAKIGGKAVGLGFSNQSFYWAIHNQPKVNKLGFCFEAFVIPKKCSTLRRIKRLNF